MKTALLILAFWIGCVLAPVREMSTVIGTCCCATSCDCIGSDMTHPCRCNGRVLPTTLNYTVTDLSGGNCSCVNGLTGTLTWDGSIWSENPCNAHYGDCGTSSEVQFAFRCNIGAPDFQWSSSSGVRYDGGPPCNFNNSVTCWTGTRTAGAEADSCNPFSVTTLNDITQHFGTGCPNAMVTSCAAGSGILQITITE